MLMIANEWAELQVVRLTYPFFTYTMLVRREEGWGAALHTIIMMGWGNAMSHHGLWCFIGLIWLAFLPAIPTCPCTPLPCPQVFILVGADVIAAGDTNPDQSDFSNYQVAVQSKILRFGIEAIFLFILFLGQVRGGQVLSQVRGGQVLSQVMSRMVLSSSELNCAQACSGAKWWQCSGPPPLPPVLVLLPAYLLCCLPSHLPPSSTQV